MTKQSHDPSAPLTGSRSGAARPWRAAVATLLVSLAFAQAIPASAAPGNLIARGITAPGGVAKLGNDIWVADHALGFCRIDPNPASVIDVNQATCNLSATSPGQVTFDADHNFVYIPDNAGKSKGVWRLTFNPATRTVGSPYLLANGTGGLSGNRATATAMGPDGALYVGFLKNGSILRVTNPHTSAQTVTLIGQSSDRRQISAMAFLDKNLYLAERTGVTMIANADHCTGTCTAAPVPGINVTAPTALASYGKDLLFIADTPGTTSNIDRYTVSTNTLDVFANAGVNRALFEFVSALGVDPAGNIYVGDDPSDGAQILRGHIWQVPAAGAPVVAGTPGTPPVAPVEPGITSGVLFARGITAPNGSVWMGTRLWVADHGLGFCRVDPDPVGLLDLNQDTCTPAGIPPGQPSFDAKDNVVYIPDLSAKSGGIYQLTFNTANETVGNPVLIGASLGGNRPIGSALGPDGNLYVSFLKNGNIVRIKNPRNAVPTVEAVGRSADGRGVLSIAFAGSDLYLTEGAGVTKIANATGCTGSCTAAPVPGITAAAPTAITSDGANMLYIADSPAVLRYTISTDTQVVYATGNTASMPFQFITGLGLDKVGNLYVGDDPSDGAQILLGHIWKVRPAH